VRLKTCGLLWLGSLAAAAPLHAGEKQDDARSFELIEQARHYWGIGDTDRDCAPTAGGEIVICARRKPAPRIDPVTEPLQPDSKMVALGSSPVPHLGGGVTMRGCFLQKCPKDLYFIDLKAIPEPPPDSDADKIAKGLMRER
jgi:hypothetical protein